MNDNEDIRVIIVEDNEQIGTISLESMLKGDTGEQGIQGIQGDKGDKGDTGAQGPQGNPGPQGQPGQDGKDYVITQEDYQAIANIVEEDIDIPTSLSDLTDDSTHRTVTDTEKATWNNKEDKSNKVTSINSLSTDNQYPSAKCVYDLVGDIESLLAEV